MKATEIKENEDSAARSWNGKKKKGRRSHQARYTRAKVASSRMKKREQKEIENRVGGEAKGRAKYV